MARRPLPGRLLCCAADALVRRRASPGFRGSSRSGPPLPSGPAAALRAEGATRGHVRGGSRAARDGDGKARRLCPQLSRDETARAFSWAERWQVRVGGQAALVLVRGRGTRARSSSLSLFPPLPERERPETESETGDMIFVKKMAGSKKDRLRDFFRSSSADQRIVGITFFVTVFSSCLIVFGHWHEVLTSCQTWTKLVTQ